MPTHFSCEAVEAELNHLRAEVARLTRDIGEFDTQMRVYYERAERAEALVGRSRRRCAMR
jgi:phage shock protein A